MVSKNNPLRDGRHLNKYCPYVDFVRRPLSTDIRHPKTGQIYSRPYYWRVSLKPDGTGPVTGVEGELWYLQDITANVANWKQLIFTNGGAPIVTVTGDAGGAVPGDGAGDIDFNGNVVINGLRAEPVFFTGDPGLFSQSLEVQVAAAITGAPLDNLDVGLASFDDTAFSVDVNGFVTLAGGPGAAIDTNTGDDAVGVGPDGAGNFNWIGVAVANTAHAKPVFFKDSTTPNAIDMDIKVSAAITGAPGDKNDAGLASFDDTAFDVDADGFVKLVGGPGPAVVSFTTNVSGPVVPNGAGVVDTTGTSVFSNGSVANTLTFDVQATAETFLVGSGPGSTATELGPLTNGQLIIGSTTAAPVLGSLLSADGSVIITPGPGSINLAVTGGVFLWVEETTTTRALSINEGVIGNNAATITMTLPVNANLGDKMCFLQKGAGTIRIAQNAGQTIHTVNGDTTTGAGGRIDTIDQWTSFCIICVTDNTDFAIEQGSHGSLLIT